MFVYIAGPFFNKEQLSVIEKIEATLDDHGIMYFSPRSLGTLKDMSPEKRKVYQDKIYDSNLLHMRECDIAILVVDDFDAGTMFEFGYLACLGRDVVTFSAKGFGLNVMLRNASKCHTTTIDDLAMICHYIDCDMDTSCFDEREDAVT